MIYIVDILLTCSRVHVLLAVHEYPGLWHSSWTDAVSCQQSTHKASEGELCPCWNNGLAAKPCLQIFLVAGV